MKKYYRAYNYVAQITLKKGIVLKSERFLDEDIDPWLFLVIDNKGEHRFTFFYKIDNPLDALNKGPFNLEISFIMPDIENKIQLNKVYDIWQREEPIGTLKIINKKEQNF